MERIVLLQRTPAMTTKKTQPTKKVTGSADKPAPAEKNKTNNKKSNAGADGEDADSRKPSDDELGLLDDLLMGEDL